MGKKGNWFSTLKKALLSSSKEKVLQETEKRTPKERKKWGAGGMNSGETTPLMPLYREPSNLEKVLGEEEREHHQISPPIPSSRQQQRRASGATLREKQRELPLHPPIFREKQQELPLHPPMAPLPRRRTAGAASYHPRSNYHHHAAIKIQAAYRGYVARSNLRTLRGLMRLQGVVRGQSVRRQTMNAMRYMQLLVKIRSQVHARRIQMMEKQALQRQSSQPNRDMEDEPNLVKKMDAEQDEEAMHDREEWDDSLLTKEEIEVRIQRKVDAVIQRERALAYAYPPRQAWRNSPRTAAGGQTETEPRGSPWWWNWLDRRSPALQPQERADAPDERSGGTPVRPANPGRAPLDSAGSPSPLSSAWKPSPSATRPRNYLAQAPKFSTPSPVSRARRSPLQGSNTPPCDSSKGGRHPVSKPRAGDFSFDAPVRDDDSLTSCPSFSVPSYMAPTASAKAKVRAQSNPKERPAAAANVGGGSKKRLSFHLPQSIGSLRWAKGSSFFSGKDSRAAPQWAAAGSHRPLDAVGNVSVDSSYSLPAGVGMKRFK